jgi:xanthine dehydrogenase small subunit
MTTATLQFVLDGEVVSIDAPPPTRTVLQYLREDCQRTGTKEGCAEGDCGACTVVVAELNEDASGLSCKAVNACIRFLPTLHGKALFTVESIAGPMPHPVQQALVEHHASQCGFCTPGFVMSLFAQYQQQQPLSRAEIDVALAGNLCRCTGYRPIIDAALHMHDYPEPNNELMARTIAALKRIDASELEFEQAANTYHAPRDLPTLLQLAAKHPHAQLLAGGTDIGLWVTKQHRELPQLISLAGVPELRTVSDDENGLRIGAMVDMQQAMTTITAVYPELQEVFLRFASTPIRNAATLGGNIANGSPIGDSMPPLIALDARVVLTSMQGEREVDLQDYFVDYGSTARQAGEVLTQILIPPRGQGLQTAAYKVSKRFDQDISAVCLGIALRLDSGNRVGEVRIAYGGMAATPKRAVHCEAVLRGQVWDEQNISTAMDALQQDFAAITDMRASASYRQRVAANLLRRFYLSTRGGTELSVYTYGR